MDMLELNLVDPITCGSCKHWLPPKDEPGRGPQLIKKQAEKFGACKRFPPIAQMIPTPQGPAKTSIHPELPGNFAACGEYTKRPG